MVNAQTLFQALKNRNIGIFTGVPDSLLSSFCSYIDDNAAETEHIIAANEGNAIALATGHHLATGKISVVYMQNSGLGNAINPLTSITDAQVYQIPMLLIVGWRGEPNIADEPQHIKQGRITLQQLNLLEIPYWLLDENSNIDLLLTEIFTRLQQTNAPVALVVRKNAFSEYKSLCQKQALYSLTREDALGHILKLVDQKALIVATTGKTSRELFELRTKRDEIQHDFLTVGGMGHTASIALGVVLAKPEKQVICIDGDGSVLMHMGALAIIGSLNPKNFIHILLNNAAHESVGGQPTVADAIDFELVSKGCGYKAYFCVENIEDLETAWHKLTKLEGAILLEIKIKIGSRANLGRPSNTPHENKMAFMKHANDE